MKRIIISLTFCLATAMAGAQQIEQWTQFYSNEYLINPAVAGFNDHFSARAHYRNQWEGIQDAPRTYMLTIDGPIIRGNMGIGGAVYSDVLGAIRRTGLRASYAYHLKLNESYKLSFSLSAGVQQFAADGSKMFTKDANDPALSNTFSSAIVPDFDASIRFSAENWHVGFAVPQVAALKGQLYEDFPTTGNILDRHYYLSGGYTYELNSDFSFEGNLLARYVNPVDMVDVMVRAIYRDMVWLGGLYRTPVISDFQSNAIGMIVGYKFENNLQIGYSYDLDVGNLNGVTQGSHEIMLGINFNKRNNKPILPAE